MREEQYREIAQRYRSLANRWENGEQLLLTGQLRIQDELRNAADVITTLLAERNAASEHMRGECEECAHKDLPCHEEPCHSCCYASILSRGQHDAWQWRGPSGSNATPDESKKSRLIDLDAAIKDARCNYGGVHDAVLMEHFLNSQPIVFASSNEAIPLEVLKKMEGEPVWLHTFSSTKKKTNIFAWALLESVSEAHMVFLRAGINSRLTKLNADYGKTWEVYYRRPAM